MVEAGVEVQEEEVGEVKEIIDTMQMCRKQMLVVLAMVMYKSKGPNAPFVKESITI